MAKELPLSQATLNLEIQEWLAEEEKSRRLIAQQRQKWLAEEEESRRLIEEQRQRDRVAQREPSAESGKVPRASHVVPPNDGRGRPIFEDAARNWAKEQQKDDELNEKIQHGAALSASKKAVRGKPVENALADLALQALISQLPTVPTHKP